MFNAGVPLKASVAGIAMGLVMDGDKYAVISDILGLEDHFGDNAELGAQENEKILSYLVANSADKTSYRRSKKIMRSVSLSNPPLRITEISYFKREHDEIPQRLIKDNEKVASLSHCDACHQKAETGSFSERHIRIPGYGKWDD